jgi:hypothetical protein
MSLLVSLLLCFQPVYGRCYGSGCRPHCAKQLCLNVFKFKTIFLESYEGVSKIFRTDAVKFINLTAQRV